MLAGTRTWHPYCMLLSQEAGRAVKGLHFGSSSVQGSIKKTKIHACLWSRSIFALAGGSEHLEVDFPESRSSIGVAG